MDAQDRGSDARHGPAEPGVPGPRTPLPAPTAPADGTDESDETDRTGGTDRADGPAVPVGAQDQPGGAEQPPGAQMPSDSPRTGIAALSPPYRIGAALALAAVAVTVCVHLGMAFLHVAPPNTVSKKHSETIADWIYPEFEQNWKLFAPNPLQQNVSVQVRAEIRWPDGSRRTTGWYDLSAQDGRDIDGNPAPSHTQQNELRRAWDFYVSTHDDDNRPVGLRGALSESYLRRIMALRLDRADAAGPHGEVARVQVRSRTTQVPPPEWSGEKASDEAEYRELPWWPLPEGETRGGVG